MYHNLEVALEYGIPEAEFWNMTLAEIRRAIKAKQEIQKRETKEKAAYDYILADLIGRSMARLYSSSATYPSLEEAYPDIYDTKELEAQKQKQRDELTILRFKQFSQFHNKKFKQEVD